MQLADSDNKQTHIVVTLHGVDEGLVCHDLGVSIEESLKTLLDGLQMLLADLKEPQQQTHRR